MNTIGSAAREQAQRCAEILNDGRNFQREQGFVQWTEEYPNLKTVYQDIADETGYIIKIDGKIAGYVSIDFSGEPAYADIRGAWRLDAAYAVVHRMAFGREFAGAGLSNMALKLIESVCLKRNVPYIRIDTAFPNRRMRHVLEKNGFVRCGVVIFRGGERIAYDKVL